MLRGSLQDMSAVVKWTSKVHGEKALSLLPPQQYSSHGSIRKEQVKAAGEITQDLMVTFPQLSLGDDKFREHVLTKRHAPKLPGS